jgi:predicted nucleic acid-binding protein
VDLLHDLQDEICVTPEVVAEVTAKEGPQEQTFREATSEWITVVRLKGDIERYRKQGLGRGEASIFLSKGKLVIDDRVARTLARAEGRDYTGLLGLMVAGVDAGLLKKKEAARILDELVESDFRVSAVLYKSLRKRWE